jgi:hypothetical protein
VKLAFLLLILAGCATPARTPPPAPGEFASAQTALEAIVIGKSTKAQVLAALGKGTEIAFDSGYEVWVYRQQLKEKEKPPRSELVLLFDRSGIVSKARIQGQGAIFMISQIAR